MSGLAVQAVTKAFGATPVLRGVDLEVPAGSLTAVLGPSGCGKTTLLRVVAGFVRPDSGTVAIGGRVVCDDGHALPPERRGVGYVAQEGALFPHLTVAGNVGYGLPWRARRERSRVAELLDLVGLPADYARRYPHELSGGQQQRVALARALAPKPPVVLLDEPFTALDAGLRAETRQAVSSALRATATTAVLVTHDQAEALSVADRVAVMRTGLLVQVGTPAEVYTRPADLGVAQFVGESVILRGVVGNGSATCALGRLPAPAVGWSGPALVLVRPEQVLLGTADGPTAMTARVEDRTYYGHDAVVTVRLADGDTVVAARCAGNAVPEVGSTVGIGIAGAALAFPLESGTVQPPAPATDPSARPSTGPSTGPST